MKLLSRLVVVLLVLAAAYVGLSWKIGLDVEKRLPEVSRHFEAIYPYFGIASQTYERGLFSSKRTVSWAFVPPGSDDDGENIPVFKTETLVKHGPFPGFRLALATMETRFLAHDPAIQQLVNLFMDGKDVLHLKTEIPLFGSSILVNVRSPEVKKQFAPGEGFVWDGLNIDALVSRKFDAYSYEGKIPGFLLESRSEKIRFSGIRAKGSGTRVFEEFPYFFAGKEAGGIDAIQMDTRRGRIALDLVDCHFTTDTGVAKGLMAASLAMKAAIFNFSDVGIEALDLDLVFEGIDARALAEFQSDILDLQQSVYRNPLESYDAIPETLGKISAIFSPSSRMELRNFSFGNAGGKIRMSGSLDLGSLADFARILMAAEMDDDPENPAAEEALAALAGELSLEASRESIQILAGEIGKNDFGNEMDGRRYMSDILDALLEKALVEESSGGILKTRVLVGDGVVTMNGIAVDAAMPQAVFGIDDDVAGEDLEY